MAGAKAHLLQPELQTDAEWRAAVLSEQAKQCLAVVDVWPDWSGPCEAMRGRLVWFKLTEAGDDLLLFSANASAIDALDRFRDHSEPTFMFLGGGQLVNVYIGCSRPRLIELVRRELRQERCVQRGTARRRVLPAGKPSPAERERRDARAAKDTAARQEEKDRAEAALRVVRLRQYRALADRLHNHTVVLLLPHALRQERLPQLTAALEASWRALGVHVLRSHRLAVSEEAADELFWERRLPQHAALVDSLAEPGGHCLALLLRKGPPPTTSPSAGGTPSERDVREDTGGQGDAPTMTRRADEDADEDEGEEERMRPGVLERIVAETVYGFYPGSASTSARNDSLSEFFSPVGGSGTSPAGTLPPASRRSSPLHSVSAGQFRPSTASWVRQSVLNLTRAGLGHSRHDLGELAAVAEDEAEDWDDHDLGEYEGCSMSSHLDQAWPKELRPVVDSVAAALLHRSDSGGLVLPGVWTPLTALSKAAAVRVLFHSFAAQYYEPEEPAPPPPPAIIVGFHASKRQQVLETAANFRADIMHLGFFTKDRKLLAETPGQYDALPYKVGVGGDYEPALDEPLTARAAPGVPGPSRVGAVASARRRPTAGAGRLRPHVRQPDGRPGQDRRGAAVHRGCSARPAPPRAAGGGGGRRRGGGRHPGAAHVLQAAAGRGGEAARPAPEATCDTSICTCTCSAGVARATDRATSACGGGCCRAGLGGGRSQATQDAVIHGPRLVRARDDPASASAVRGVQAEDVHVQLRLAGGGPEAAEDPVGLQRREAPAGAQSGRNVRVQSRPDQPAQPAQPTLGPQVHVTASTAGRRRGRGPGGGRQYLPAAVRHCRHRRRNRGEPEPAQGVSRVQGGNVFVRDSQGLNPLLVM